MTQPLVSIRGLRMDLPGDDGPAHILLGIDLDVARGEAFGLVGESGSGKSMTLRCIARLAPPGAHVTGTITVGDADVGGLRRTALRHYRGRTVGFIFQDPRVAINPIRRIGDFLLEAARDSGDDLTATSARARELLANMGITDAARRMRQYPFELSGGLLQRIMIASVLLARPRLILADEPTTALDVTTQSDVLVLTDDLRREQDTAMIFVTHDLDLALAFCSRVAVMYAGMIVETATSDVLRDRPRHPYTIGLLASRPPLDHRLERIPAVPGTPLPAAEYAAGCPFVTRCPVRVQVCHTSLPALTDHPAGQVRCHRADEIAAGTLQIDFVGAAAQEAAT